MKAVFGRCGHKLHLALTKHLLRTSNLQGAGLRERTATLPIRVGQPASNTPAIHSLTPESALRSLVLPLRVIEVSFSSPHAGPRDLAQAVPCLNTLPPDREHSLPQLLAPTSSSQGPWGN